MAAAGLALVDPTKTGDSSVIPDFGFHTLRHVACSLWIEQGESRKKVSKWAGHSSVQITEDIYGHLWPDHADDHATAQAAAASIFNAK